ncbi:MAG: hypothetical protein KGD61_10725 [Candidatus Lokiarchaeota archaeon]|nr:hypothetical protein [Candidatus Lokiarchaeota archaeon]
MRLAALKKEINRDYGTERELTRFQKNILSIIALSFYMEYGIGEKIHKCMEKNQPNIDALINDFDLESKLNRFPKKRI